jgi:hypothetical protein
MKTSVRMMQCALLVLVVGLAAGPAWAAKAKKEKKAEGAKEEAPAAFRYGADLRLREEYFDNLPIIADPPGVTRGGENNYFRIRPRIWTELDAMENVTLRARIVNEFRIWETPSSMAGKAQRSTYKFPDEWVFDHLYLDVRNLMGDSLDLRIGRQDLIYGTGKVVLEGTPKDGSRTIYFNAIKAVWKAMPKTTIDVFGIYNESLDEIAINDADRDLTGQTSANNDITESGVGVYLKNKSIEKMPYEAYYIYKNESEWDKAAGTNAPVSIPEVDVHTVGFRVMPQLAKALKGNLEFAYQMGEQGETDLEGWMLDGSLSYTLPVVEKLAPVADIGFYALSGDDPDTTDTIEAWNPLFARYPQYSELYVYCWDAEAAGRWQNVMMPYAQLSLKPCAKSKFTAMVGYLLAPEENGPGGGDERGLLLVLKDEITLAEKLFTSKDKLTGHLWAEILEPGNYYNVEDTGYFLRWEVMYAF